MVRGPDARSLALGAILMETLVPLTDSSITRCIVCTGKHANPRRVPFDFSSDSPLVLKLLGSQFNAEV